jgi:photosystem II protein
MASSMQFIKGIEEPTVPDVKLTRSRDGSSGVGACRALLNAWLLVQFAAVFTSPSELFVKGWS